MIRPLLIVLLSLAVLAGAMPGCAKKQRARSAEVETIPPPPPWPPPPEPDERLPLDHLGTDEELSASIVAYLEQACDLLRQERTVGMEVAQALGTVLPPTEGLRQIDFRPMHPALSRGSITEAWLRGLPKHDVWDILFHLKDPNTLTLAALRRRFGASTLALVIHANDPQYFIFYDAERQEHLPGRCVVIAETNLSAHAVAEVGREVSRAFPEPPSGPDDLDFIYRRSEWSDRVAERLNARVIEVALRRDNMVAIQRLRRHRRH